MELRTRDDFQRTIERFEAWWRGAVIDRPPVTVYVKPTRPYSGPDGTALTALERRTQVEYAVESAIARLEQRDFVADSFPIVWPNLGPHLTAGLFGGHCELAPLEADGAWSTPIVQQPEDWDRILQTPCNLNHPYWQLAERMTDYAIARCDRRYLVGLTDLMGNYDILAALRGAEELCLDILNCPDLLRQVGRHVTRGLTETVTRSHAKVAAAGFGSTTWCPMYHRGPAYVPSCDFWCMVSPAVARNLIVPDIRVEMRALEKSIFHLDGVNALQHLDAILEIEELDAVEWVYGCGQGPAARWIDVYRRIRRAGKSIEVLAENGTDALHVLQALGPEGLWLHVNGSEFHSVAHAQDFIRAVEKEGA